jgi:hypothetical protein
MRPGENACRSRSGEVEVEYVPDVCVGHAQPHCDEFEEKVCPVEYQRLNACLQQFFRQMIKRCLEQARCQFVERITQHFFPVQLCHRGPGLGYGTGGILLLAEGYETQAGGAYDRLPIWRRNKHNFISA